MNSIRWCYATEIWARALSWYAYTKYDVTSSTPTVWQSHYYYHHSPSGGRQQRESRGSWTYWKRELPCARRLVFTRFHFERAPVNLDQFSLLWFTVAFHVGYIVDTQITSEHIHMNMTRKHKLQTHQNHTCKFDRKTCHNKLTQTRTHTVEYGDRPKAMNLLLLLFVLRSSCSLSQNYPKCDWNDRHTTTEDFE